MGRLHRTRTSYVSWAEASSVMIWRGADDVSVAAPRNVQRVFVDSSIASPIGTLTDT